MGFCVGNKGLEALTTGTFGNITQVTIPGHRKTALLSGVSIIFAEDE